MYITQKPEKVFLYIAVIVGLLLVFLIKPMQTPDENFHFWYSYNLSRLNFPAYEDGMRGYYSSREVWDFIQLYTAGERAGRSFSYWEKHFLGHIPLNEPFHQELLPTTWYIELNPFGHMFATLGIFLGRVIFTLTGNSQFLSPYNLLLFGRLGSLSFYIAGIYFAIKLNPYFKRTMLLLALMPMSIFLGASLTADAAIIPIGFLSFSIFLRFITDEKLLLNKRELIITSIVAFAFATVKGPQLLPFMLLLFAIPIKRFINVKFYWRSIIICTVVIAVGLLILNLASIIYGDIFVDPWVSMTNQSQRDFLRNNPFHLITVFFNTISYSLAFWAFSFFGILGNLDVNFPIPVVVLFYILFFITFFYECLNSTKVSIKVRVFAFIPLFINIAGMVYSLYVGWTALVTGEIGGNIATGIQGRYFIPIFLFSAFIFMGTSLKKFKYNKQAQAILDDTTALAALFLPIFTVIIILMVYYIY